VKNRWGCAVIGILLVVIAVLVVCVVALVVSDEVGKPFGGNKVVVLRIEDVIYDAKPFLDRLELYEDRDDVKAVVVRIESPGGTVAGSQEIADALNRVRFDKKKIVVASIGNVGASGGYMIACASDAIVVNRGSLVGSIGVIIEHFQIAELARKIGVAFDPVYSGKMKNTGSIARPMTAEERAQLQSIVDDVYDQFFEDVLESRSDAIAECVGVDENDSPAIERALASVADGRAITGSQAIEIGLADRFGGLAEAIEAAGELARIEGEPKVIHDNPENAWAEFEKLFGEAKDLVPGVEWNRYLPRPGLWYLYQL